MANQKVIALIVAGGSGGRLGSETPKQYLDINGFSILQHTINCFSEQVDGIKIVISPAHKALYEKSISSIVMEPTFGGSQRQESVLAGLESLAPLNPEYVLIHDAVRPFAHKKLIADVITGLGENSAVIPAITSKDTLKIVEDGFVCKTLPRETVYVAQTPQGFRFKNILEAHRDAKAQGLSFTDDAGVAEHFGIAVKVVPGSETNYKITTREDLIRAEIQNR